MVMAAELVKVVLVKTAVDHEGPLPRRGHEVRVAGVGQGDRVGARGQRARGEARGEGARAGGRWRRSAVTPSRVMSTVPVGTAVARKQGAGEHARGLPEGDGAARRR